MGLRENTTYGDMSARFSSLSQAAASAAQKVHKDTAGRRASNVSQYSGITGAMNSGQQSAPAAPQSHAGHQGHGSFNEAPVNQSSLGTVTVQPGGATNYEKLHTGIDIANAKGTNIPTYVGGNVVGVESNPSGFGNSVLVKDDQGNTHRYSHLNKSYVTQGQRINKGYMVGTMGNTGSTYSTTGGDGTHLDYRVRDMYGKYVDPRRFLR